jgi:hypothetical protein
MGATINIDDIPPATRKKLGLQKTRKRQFTAEKKRSWAIRVLASIAELSQDQRRQVLEHSLKLNKV